MAKDKSSVNPATAALKSQKQREIKKSKAATAAQRTEKLARRNPDRLQKQLDELSAQKKAQGGKLRPKDQQTLETLERDLRLVRKARQDQGAGGGEERKGRRDSGEAPKEHLGKRRWGDRDAKSRDEPESEETETDEEVRNIPMPRDTPPPIPPRHLQRKVRKGRMSMEDALKERSDRQTKDKPQVEIKKVYSSAPQIRDLQKESVSKFVPAAVAARKRQEKKDDEAKEGRGDRLLEPEELEEIERRDARKVAERRAVAQEAKHEAQAIDDMDEEEHRLLLELGQQAIDTDIKGATDEAEKEAEYEMMAEEVENTEGIVAQDVDMKLHHVEVEEVEDEEAGGKPHVEEVDDFW